MGGFTSKKSLKPHTRFRPKRRTLNATQTFGAELPLYGVGSLVYKAFVMAEDSAQFERRPPAMPGDSIRSPKLPNGVIARVLDFDGLDRLKVSFSLRVPGVVLRTVVWSIPFEGVSRVQ